MLPFLRDLPPCEVGMEASASAHHWGRLLQAMGHTVHLLPPQYVKPFVIGQKNDANDAAAICAAMAHPGIPRLGIVEHREAIAQAALGPLRQPRGILAPQFDRLRKQAPGLGLIGRVEDGADASGDGFTLVEPRDVSLRVLLQMELAALQGTLGKVARRAALSPA